MTSELHRTTAAHKVCTKCKGEPQLLSEFSKFHRSDDGLQHVCKSCKRIIDAKYRNIMKAHKAAMQKEWRKVNPGRTREHTLRWQRNNKERKVRVNKEWQARNGH